MGRLRQIISPGASYRALDLEHDATTQMQLIFFYH